jgi:hypothetical protein
MLSNIYVIVDNYNILFAFESYIICNITQVTLKIIISYELERRKHQ